MNAIKITVLSTMLLFAVACGKESVDDRAASIRHCGHTPPAAQTPNAFTVQMIFKHVIPGYEGDNTFCAYTEVLIADRETVKISFSACDFEQHIEDDTVQMTVDCSKVANGIHTSVGNSGVGFYKDPATGDEKSGAYWLPPYAQKAL